MNGWTLLRAEWERVLGAALIVLGGVALLLGYLGVANSAYFAEEMAYIVSGAVLGVFLAVVGVGLLMSADLHDEWRKLDRIEAAIRGESRPDASVVLTDRRESAAVEPVRANGLRAPETPRVTAFSRVSLAPDAVGAAGLTIDWRQDGLRRAMTLSTTGVAAAAGLLGLAWKGTAGTTDVGTASQWIAVALGSVMVAMVTSGAYPLWLRLRLGKRKRSVIRDWAGTAAGSSPVGKSPDRGPGGHLLVGKGLRRFHVEGCPTLRGVETSVCEPTTVDASLEPCRICQPQ